MQLQVRSDLPQERYGCLCNGSGTSQAFRPSTPGGGAAAQGHPWAPKLRRSRGLYCPSWSHRASSCSPKQKILGIVVRPRRVAGEYGALLFESHSAVAPFRGNPPVRVPSVGHFAQHPPFMKSSDLNPSRAMRLFDGGCYMNCRRCSCLASSPARPNTPCHSRQAVVWTDGITRGCVSPQGDLSSPLAPRGPAVSCQVGRQTPKRHASLVTRLGHTVGPVAVFMGFRLLVYVWTGTAGDPASGAGSRGAGLHGSSDLAR